MPARRRQALAEVMSFACMGRRYPAEPSGDAPSRRWGARLALGQRKEPQAFSGPLVDRACACAARFRQDQNTTCAYSLPTRVRCWPRPSAASSTTSGAIVVGSACDPDARLTRLVCRRPRPDVLASRCRPSIPSAGPLVALEHIRAAAPGPARRRRSPHALDETLSRRRPRRASSTASSSTSARRRRACGGDRRRSSPATRSSRPGWLRQVQAGRAERARSCSSARASARSFELLSLGMDNDQIAARLYISRNTVQVPRADDLPASRGAQPGRGVAGSRRLRRALRRLRRARLKGGP